MERCEALFLLPNYTIGTYGCETTTEMLPTVQSTWPSGLVCDSWWAKPYTADRVSSTTTIGKRGWR